MDNPQETCKIAWLAGIWDGEGSIGVRNNRKISQYSPRVSVYNSNAAIIERIVEILDQNEIGYHVNEKTYGGFPGSHKQVWAISICTLTGARKLLSLLMPYLVGKIEHAKLLKRFVDSRMDRRAKVKRNSDAPYNGEELEAIASIYDLNGNQRGSSETTREAIAQLNGG